MSIFDSEGLINLSDFNGACESCGINCIRFDDNKLIVDYKYTFKITDIYGKPWVICEKSFFDTNQEKTYIAQLCKKYSNFKELIDSIEFIPYDSFKE